LDMVSKVNGKPLNVIEEKRRAGDPPQLIAGVDKIHQTLDWSPKFDNLEMTVKTALEWERLIAEGKVYRPA